MTTTPASLTLRLLTMAGTAARLGLEQVLTLAGIRTPQRDLSLRARRALDAMARRPFSSLVETTLETLNRVQEILADRVVYRKLISGLGKECLSAL